MAKPDATTIFANSGGTVVPGFRHYSRMAKKRDEPKVYAREWREKLKAAHGTGFTLEKIAERAGMSVSYLSDLEKGHPKKRWNVDQLAAVAFALGLDDFQDLFRHPDRRDPLLSLVKGLSGDERDTAERVLTAILKTGTNG